MQDLLPGNHHVQKIRLPVQRASLQLRRSLPCSVDGSGFTDIFATLFWVCTTLICTWHLVDPQAYLRDRRHLRIGQETMIAYVRLSPRPFAVGGSGKVLVATLREQHFITVSLRTFPGSLYEYCRMRVFNTSMIPQKCLRTMGAS